VKTKQPEVAPRVRLAEDIGRWLDQGTFADLLEVEEYVADLADLIVLSVESPGSIAELGAFSALERVRPKLLAIVNKRFKEPSFISDGPVRRLQLIGSPVYKYAWYPSSRRLNNPANLDVFEDLSADICDLLQRRQQAHPKEQSLDLKSHGHAMLIVADLVDIAFAATVTDLHECLSALGRAVERSDLQKYLFLLTDLKIVGEEYPAPSMSVRAVGPT
jgi:hypothetical protein